MAEILMRHPKLGKDDIITAQTEAQAAVYEQSGWERLPAKDQPKEGE